MKKSYKINGADTRKKVDYITRILFGQLNDTELDLLAIILDYSTNNAITITQDISNAIKKEVIISDTSFSTCLHRMEKKGLFARTGKTITFDLVFAGIHELEKLSIVF